MLSRAAFSWLIRLVIGWLFITALRPAAPRVVTDSIHVVETAHPQVCVHTRLIDEVEAWKIQRSLALVREMGASTIVEFFPWAYLEPQRGRYDWSSADRIIEYAHAQGLQIIARMGLVPAWAQEISGEWPGTQRATLNTLPPEAYDDFAQFVAAFASRYAGLVDHLIIWNEPNLSFEWGYEQVSAAQYVDLLRAVYHPAHEANPDVVILAAGLAPTLEPAGSPHGLNDILYLDDLYAAGGAAYFDALAVHTYGFTDPPEAEPAFSTLNFRRVELLREVMVAHGDAETPIYITETGWNDNPRWNKSVSPSQRVAYTLRAFEYADGEWPWLRRLCLWAFRYPAPTFSYPDDFTLVTTDFTLKPIYHAVRAYARALPQEESLWLPPPQDARS